MTNSLSTAGGGLHKVVNLCDPCACGPIGSCGVGGLSVGQLVRMRYCLAGEGDNEAALTSADSVELIVVDSYGRTAYLTSLDPVDSLCVYADVKLCTKGSANAYLRITKGTDVVTTAAKTFYVG